MSSGPAYDLRVVQALVAGGSVLITNRAGLDAGKIGFGGAEIVACVLALTGREFYKSMAALKRPGLMQDVYRSEFAGRSLYVKLQIRPFAASRTAVVISFKAL